MTDDLRTRIAAAVADYHQRYYHQRWGIKCECGADHAHAFGVADAVIAELKLQPETLCNPGGAILTRLDGRVLADNRYMRRWATPWECAESPVK